MNGREYNVNSSYGLFRLIIVKNIPMIFLSVSIGRNKEHRKVEIISSLK